MLFRSDGKVMADVTGKLNGRGAYIKRDAQVLEKAKKSKILERALETVITDDVYDEINQIINR